ncbi:MAG: hypothetical protein LHW46_01485 [Candidatus Cloacimonetes bacterium]|nr:hypothetical protein [Candidatus Cloacimonadota bacterium]MCK9334340.1 hypothetical protein [Candidatus Cloacimonadota bacterium]MDD2544280.1 hypothetical protein [Candidatus Cloacimonadota bacterium]MDD4034128.1 hypothetical protein [Candidatus Cloacimonadota bacterium]MDD4667366.1 hypothetical protein [Candidatus Cloacimonadota bacterium]
MANRLLVLFLLIGLCACSRPQKVLQPPARVAADATLSLAQSLELKQRWQDAIQTYRSAASQYEAFGEIRGQVYAYAGLARIAYQNAESEDFDSYREQIRLLIELGDPPSQYIADLLDIYLLESQGDYAGILRIAEDSYEYPLHIRMQMLSHRLQSESYLNPGYTSTSYSDLQRLSNRYRRLLKKDFSADPTVLANANYAMAYYNYLHRQYNEALRRIDAAIDLDYRYENFGGLGSAYWLRGKIREAIGEPTLALHDYVKAKHIFNHYQDPEMQKQVESAITRLQGD